LIALPPDPDLENVRFYEDKILEYLPDSSASIRLARVDGNDEREVALISNTLRQQRHHCWMQILSGLIQSLQLKLYEGDPGELIPDIPTDNRDIDQAEFYPSQDESLVLDLWGKGYTAKQIAQRTGRTEKTILNRLTLMRKTYGEQIVPRRRMT
jgi:DNA-directed RNA polymerase specialized sigma24 family protein